MKNLILSLIIISCSVNVYSQPKDISTIDGLMEALYGSISGPAGERDWDYFHSLFKPNAIMGALSRTPEGDLAYNGFDPGGYVERNGPFFVQNGFWEEELNREVVQYGELAHVFSSYEFRLERDGEEIRQRGINSLQLVFEDDRWWVVSIQWNSERDDLPLPKKMAKKRS